MAISTSPDQIGKIAAALSEGFDLARLHPKKHISVFSRKKEKREQALRQYREESVEFSIECNPATVSQDLDQKIKAWKKAGINRVSIGLQSTDDKLLEVLGRLHSASDFLDTYMRLREAGFDNINIDLMQAIPGQNLASWQRTLAAAVSLKPEHISAYSLIIEDGTPFAAWYRPSGKDGPGGTVTLPDGRIYALPGEDEERRIYSYTKEVLEKVGYSRYEISNYCLPGYECRHNKGYWKRTDYLGLGLNSSSLIGDTRWKNTPDIEEYISKSSQPESIRRDTEILSVRDRMAEFMFLGLRLTEGVSKQEFFDAFGQSFDYVFGSVAAKLEDQMLLKESVTEDGDIRVSLTDRGVDVSNTVMAEFMP